MVSPLSECVNSGGIDKWWGIIDVVRTDYLKEVISLHRLMSDDLIQALELR